MGITYRQPIRAGIFVRREFRRILLSKGIEFTEEKGWLDSVFIVKTDKLYVLNALKNLVESLNGD